MTLLIVFILIALGISFLCSLLEATILSVRIPYAKVLMDKGNHSGRILYNLKQNIDRPLSAILTLNTIAHTVGAAGAGAQALVVFGDTWVALFTAIFTLVILFFSEIVPKTLGSVYWRKLAPASAHVLAVLVILMYPLVSASRFLMSLMTGKRKVTRVTREELVAMTQISEDDGALIEREETCIINLLRLSKIPTESIMTPLSVVESYPEKSTVEEVLAISSFPTFSRLPVYKESPHQFTGFILRKELLTAAAKDYHSTKIADLSRPIHVVNEFDSVRDILDEFIKRREHLFGVENDNGKATGIVTLEDAIETLLGTEIVDELDRIVDMRKYAGHS